MSLKLCVVGCGGFSETVHGPAQKAYVAAHPETELAACCDLDPERARSYARRFGHQRTYTNAEEMLERESPDAVFVLVAPRVAAEVAGMVLRRGLPLFVEKPPCLTMEELDELIRLAKHHRVPTQVGFNRRTMPVMEQARAILDGDFPAVTQVVYDMTRLNRHDEDFTTTAIHAFDAARFVAGSPYRWARLHFGALPGVPESRWNVTLEGEAESGASIHVHIQPAAGINAEGFTVHGTGQSLDCVLSHDDPGRLHLTHWHGGVPEVLPIDTPAPHSVRQGIDREVAAFCDAIRQGAVPGPSLADAIQPVRLMEAMRRHEADIIHFRNPAA